MSTGPKNILLIQLGDIGDVVLTTPTIRAVRETYPEARVSVLVRKPFGSLLSADPCLDEVIESAKGAATALESLRSHAAFAIRIRKKRYDLVIDLRTGDRGAILAFLTGAAARVGRRGNKNQFWHGLLFTEIVGELKRAPVPVHPGADQSLSVVRAMGIDTTDSTPRLYVADADLANASRLLLEAGITPGTEFVTVNPFSRWKYKEWAQTKWAEVIDQIWEARRRFCVLIGSPEEAVACQEIVEGRSGRAASLAGRTTLGELAAVISMSRLHLGVDSAAPHIAAALGVPTATIHGPTDWRSWRIVDDQHKVIVPVRTCVPCGMMGCNGSGKSICLDELDRASVVQTVLELI